MRSRTTTTTCAATAAHGSHSSGTLHNNRHIAAGNYTVDSRRSYTKFGNGDGNGRWEREAGHRRGGISSGGISGTTAEERIAVDGGGRGGAGRGGEGERGVKGDERRSGKKSPRVKPPLPPPLTQVGCRGRDAFVRSSGTGVRVRVLRAGAWEGGGAYSKYLEIMSDVHNRGLSTRPTGSDPKFALP